MLNISESVSVSNKPLCRKRMSEELLSFSRQSENPDMFIKKLIEKAKQLKEQQNSAKQECQN